MKHRLSSTLIACLCTVVLSSAGAFELGTCHVFDVVESTEVDNPTGRIQITQSQLNQATPVLGEFTQNDQLADSEFLIDYSQSIKAPSSGTSFKDSAFFLKEEEDSSFSESSFGFGESSSSSGTIFGD